MIYIWIGLITLLAVSVCDVLECKEPAVGDISRRQWLIIVIFFPIAGAGLWFSVSRSDEDDRTDPDPDQEFLFYP